jgi:hypothetical protein
MTTRQNMLALALGGLVIAGVPYVSANAQSGDALAHAERTCLDYGLRPNSSSFETCVSRSASAYDRGEPGIAAVQARAARDARDTCMTYNLDPRTLGYQQCVTREVDRRTARAYDTYDEPYRPGPHAVVMIDDYGTRYDRYGNVLDRNGYVIRYAP